MEQLKILPDNAEEFDEIIADSLQEGMDMKLIVKPKATESGLPVVMVTFTVKTDSGAIKKAQAVTTLANLINAVDFLKIKYHSILNSQ